MQADMRFKIEAKSFLTERLGHAAAPSWRYDLMRSASKFVKLLIEQPAKHASDLRPNVEAIVLEQCEFASSDPVATERHVTLVLEALEELHGECAPRDSTLMRPLVAGR